MLNTLRICFVSLVSSLLLSAVAPDATEMGPLSTSEGEYRLPAQIDADVLASSMTEVWAQVYYPSRLEKGPYPVLVFLHGNHGTCGTGTNPRQDNSCRYTRDGTCPENYVVTPNHLGYAYLAKNLATWGYVVVSINANRGITCGSGSAEDSGLNLARGRLILRHLSLLSQWNASGGNPTTIGVGPDGLKGMLDLSQVGIMGHSRGGEGARAAFNIYKDEGSIWPSKIPGLNIKAIYEIGAVDGQTGRILNADGAIWNQLLPMCDGDVSDLQGRKPFERMMSNKSEKVSAQKSLYYVFGANHNFYNTEWQTSDSFGCFNHEKLFDKKGGDLQRLTTSASLTAFFRAHVGVETQKNLNQNFNPSVSLPKVVTDVTRVDRDFSISPNGEETLRFEEFSQPTGKNSEGADNNAKEVEVAHAVSTRSEFPSTGQVSWKKSGAGVFFQTNWENAGKGRDVSQFATLDFRVAQKISSPPKPAVDFSLVLVDAEDKTSASVKLSDYVVLGPPGHSRTVTFQTARIPLVDFKGMDLTRVRGLRFVFDNTDSGEIVLAHVRVSKKVGVGDVTIVGAAAAGKGAVGLQGRAVASEPPQKIVVAREKNKVLSVKKLKSSGQLLGASAVEVTVQSQVLFPVRNELPILNIGKAQSRISRYPDNGKTDMLIFTFESTDSLEESLRGANSPLIRLQYGADDSRVWEFDI